jgi:SprT protein
MDHWPNIQHDFTLRGRAAGQFRFNRRNRKVLILRWNVEAMTKYPEQYLKETVPHEVAHLIVWVLHIERKIAYYDHHGWNWRRVMNMLGVPAKKTHRYKLTYARVRTL